MSTVASLAAPYQFPLTLVSFNGPFVNGIPTYPYALQIGFFPIPGMCDDYYHDGAPGDHWIAYVHNLPTANLAYMRFGSQGIVPYEESAWLLQQTFTQPFTQWPDMNYAVWHIFNPTVPIDSNSQIWIDLAAANYAGGNYKDVWVATPVDINAPPTGDQEFLMVITTPSPFGGTPEPGSLVLLSTGVAGIVATLRRRWRP